MKSWGVAIGISAVASGALVYIVAAVLDGAPRTGELDRLPAVGEPGAERRESGVGEPAASQTGGARPPTPPERAPGTQPTRAEGILAQRFERVEKEILELRRTIENLVPASDVTEIEYADPASFEHADRYYDDGKFASAAGVYLKFLEHYPDHPDALDMLRKARDGYRQAGYGARAVDVQKRLLEEYQIEDRYIELRTLADLEKGVKRYDDAIAHADEAARATTDTQQRLVALAYRAWYVELGRGPAAGLAAHRDVYRFAQEVGMGEYKVTKRVQSHIERLQKVVDSGNY